MLQYECGVLFIWSKVFQNLYTDKRFGSTLSFCTNPPHRGRYGKQTYFQTMKNEKYIAPEAEVLEIAVEQGFATSGSGGQEEIGGSKEEGEW